MPNQDDTQISDAGTVGASLHACDQPHWQVHGKLEKYNAPSADVYAGKVEPYETLETTGNVLLRGGADVLWGRLISTQADTTGAGYSPFNNGNAAIGVGNSTTAAVNTQTDLQANSSRQYFKGMDATFPTHTTGTGSTGALNVVFKATFTTAQANFAWNEWTICNSTNSTGANTARRLNRKVQSLGTKTTSATWAFTATLSLA